MDAIALREMQAPLKRQYRDDPESARVPVHATATFADAGITCTVESWAGPIRAGLHEATGGDGRDACSGDLLMQALLACVGVTLRSVATALGIDVRSAKLRVRGEFDARGTLGVSRDVAVGVTNVRVDADLDTDADDDMLARLEALTERYCVVGKSLREPPAIVVRRR